MQKNPCTIKLNSQNIPQVSTKNKARRHSEP